MSDKSEIVNRVALSMQGLIGHLNETVTDIAGTEQHNIILVIGAGDVVQYASNSKREDMIEVLKGLFARWKLDMPDLLPGEITPGDLRPFAYLLADFEKALASGENIEAARGELMNYVGALVVKR